MNWMVWLILLLLVAAAGSSVWFAFRSPKFVARLTEYASKQAWKVIRPAVTKPLSPEELQKAQIDFMRGRGDDYWRKRSGAPPKG